MDKNKTLKVLGLIFVVGLTLYGSAYWGQRRAHESQTKVDATFLLLIQKQSECYELKDWDCIKRINTLTAYLAATRWRIIRDYGLVDESVASEVDEFLIWQESGLPAILDSTEQTPEEECEDPANKSGCPPSLAIRPAPYFINGELRGYRIYPGQDPSAFESLGLNFGDLVTEVDGQPLSDPSVAFELLKRISSGQPVQVEVERDGKFELIEIQSE